MKLKEATAKFKDHLKALGKSDRTIFTYGKDLEQIEEFFGVDTAMGKINPQRIAKFLKSDIALKCKRKGELVDRQPRTVDKLIRLTRQFFIWATDQKIIEKNPLPKSVPLGRQKAA